MSDLPSGFVLDTAASTLPPPLPTPGGALYVNMGRSALSADAILDMIAHHESGGRNIMQGIVPAGGGYNPSVGRVTGPSTAQGPWQITNSTWRDTAPSVGVDINIYPTAMSVPVPVQRQVAAKLLETRGLSPWTPYNPALRRALAAAGVADVPRAAESQQAAPQAAAAAADDDAPATPAATGSPDDLALTDLTLAASPQPASASALSTADLPAGFVLDTPAPAAAPMPAPAAQPSMLARAGTAALNAARDTAALPAGLALGALRVPVGLGQLSQHAGAAIGIPGFEALAKSGDTVAQDLESAIAALPAHPDAWITPQGLASVGNIGASMAALPVNWLAQVPRLARPVAAAAVGAGAGAAQPIIATPQSPYGEQVQGNALTGALTGLGLQAGGELASAGANFLRHVVAPSTVTQAFSRLLGENTKRLTPEVLKRVKDRTAATFTRIENANPLPVNGALITRLGDIDRRAQDIPEAIRPIGRAIDGVVDRINSQGVLPGGSASQLWHEGSIIDSLARNPNPAIRGLAQELKTALRDAYSAALSPAEAAIYNAARHTWRDLKIAEKVLSRRPGRTQLPPSELNVAIGQRFRTGATQTDEPPVLELGRAIGQTWVPEAASLPRQIVGRGIHDLVGAAFGAGVGGAMGGPAGMLIGGGAGGYIADRLAQLRFARGNALRAFRGASPPVSNNLRTMGRFAPPATVGLTQPENALAAP